MGDLVKENYLLGCWINRKFINHLTETSCTEAIWSIYLQYKKTFGRGWGGVLQRFSSSLSCPTA